jgi:hypothetical protein
MTRFIVIVTCLLLSSAPGLVFGAAPGTLLAKSSERVPGMKIDFPDTWSVGRNMRDAVEIAKWNERGEVEVRLVFGHEQRLDDEDAFKRAADIVSQFDQSTQFVVVNGWPAVIHKARGFLPQKGVTSPVPAVRHSIVLIAGSQIYQGNGWALQSAPSTVELEVSRTFNGLKLHKAGNDTAAQDILRRLREVRPKPPVSPVTPSIPKSPASAASAAVAGVASNVNTGRGELEVAVSRWGQNFVVATNNGVFSSQAGSTLTASTNLLGSTLPTNGDPSVAWAGSGSFYQTGIRVAPTGCSLEIGRSDDKGRTFSWNATPPHSCALPPLTSATRCFPDQEHMSADPLNVSSPNQDLLYVTWEPPSISV